MLRNLLLSILLFTALVTSAPIHAQQAGDGELHLSAGSTMTVHLTEAYASCPAGTRLKVKVSTSIDSRVNKTGDPVEGVLAASLSCNNQIILPAGTQVMGDFVEMAAPNASQSSSYGIELTYVAAKAGSRSIHAEMKSSQTSARNQPERAAVQKAGANKDREIAGTQSRRPAASPGPLFYLNLAASLAQGMSQQALANQAAKRGIDFYFDDGDAEWLHAMGATDALLNALRAARYNYVDYYSEKVKWQAEAARDEAVALSAGARRPEDPGIHWLLGIALQFQEKHADAMPEFRRAIVLKPDLSCAHRGLAESLIASGQKEEALSEARESVRLMPNGPGALMVLGYVLAQNGDSQGGIAELREAVRIAPDYFDTHYALASGLLAQKNTDEAIHEFQEAVRLNPVSEPSHFGLGRAQFAKPDYDAATFEFREALRLRPNDSNARTWLAGALYNGGQSEEAAAEAHTALLY
ncbi:MAG: tetratricopeptide repeat protein, partial [Candidatus Acidiferrales bacterium]